MWEKCTNWALRGQSIRKSPYIGGILAIFLASLTYTAPVRADAVSNAVLNYTGSYWAAFYDGNLNGFNPSGSVSLILNNDYPSDGIEIEDPAGNHYFDSSLN